MSSYIRELVKTGAANNMALQQWCDGHIELIQEWLRITDEFDFSIQSIRACPEGLLVQCQYCEDIVIPVEYLESELIRNTIAKLHTELQNERQKRREVEAQRRHA